MQQACECPPVAGMVDILGVVVEVVVKRRVNWCVVAVLVSMVVVRSLVCE